MGGRGRGRGRVWLDFRLMPRHVWRMVRQKDKPWETLGMSRTTWYRHGKPDKPLPMTKVTKAYAAEKGFESIRSYHLANVKNLRFSSRRTYQREMRVLESPLGRLFSDGKISAYKADKILAMGPVFVERVLEKVRRYTAAKVKLTTKS